MTIEVAVLYLNDGLASVANIACDVFGNVGIVPNLCAGEAMAPRFTVRTASIDGRPTRAHGGYVLQPQTSIARLPRVDIILVPDAGFHVDPMVERHRALLPWLRRRHERGTRILSVCSGVGLVAAAGLLDGRRATTHWALIETYARRFPKVEWHGEALVTEDGALYCGGGIYACFDLCLYVIEKLCGRDVAIGMARAMLLDMPRSDQTTFAALPLATPHSDDAIRRAEHLLQERYRTDVSIEAIAARVGMSERNFERRFRTATGSRPRAYLQKLRVADARRRLEAGAPSIQQVATAVGYTDLQFFRAIFKRHAGLSPSDYRDKFGAPPASLLTAR